MAAQQSSTVGRPRVDEGTKKGRFTVKESAVDPSNPCADDSVADEPGTGSAPLLEPERVRAESMVPPLVTQMPTNQETVCLASLHKLQEEFTLYHKNFRETWSSIEAQVRALEDANGSSLVPNGSHDDLMVGTVQATRPNTPTSTSAYSTSSCTSRTPPATSYSDLGSVGNRSIRTAAETHASNAGDSKEKRESTLRMWSDLGDTLQEVVQRNRRLEDENLRLQQEIDAVDKQVADLKAALAIDSGGSSSSAAGYQAWTEPSLLDTDLLGREIGCPPPVPDWNQQFPQAVMQAGPSQIQNVQPQAREMERVRFSIRMEPAAVDEARGRPLDKSPEDDGALTVRHVAAPGMEVPCEELRPAVDAPGMVCPPLEQVSAAEEVLSPPLPEVS